MSAYYNENDPKQAARLRLLIRLKVIADGEVDERSIKDVRPNDLGGFTQCHFFAGIGGWSQALRLAGWPDDRPVWTGSCPCQSFSAAGQGKGFADERHLWPAWFHLVGELQPATIFGEQVDAAIKYGWLDLVQSDLEAFGYAIGHSVIPAASVGAPHGRHRLWFVAQSKGQQYDWSNAARRGRIELADGSSTSGMGLPNRNGCESWSEAATTSRQGDSTIAASGTAEYTESQQARLSRLARERRKTAGFWSHADWIPCRDDKWRPIEPGIFPLAHGVPGRVDLLRGFGNAIVPQVAAAFIEAATT